MSIMGLPRQLTEKQMKFAELLVYNEGRKSASECAYEVDTRQDRDRQHQNYVILELVLLL